MKSRFLFCALAWSMPSLLLASVFAVGQVAVTTYHNDNYRSGANTNETILTPSNVNEVQFGKLHTLSVTGYVYAQPLYVPGVNINGVLHNVVYVVTEHDQVYAFDANTGNQLWEKNFLISTNPTKTILPISYTDNGCSGTGREIGITSTPVIDLTTNEIYIVAATKEVVNNVTTFYNRMHVLDIGTGVEKMLGPYFGAPIKAKTPGTGSGSVDGYLSFNPLMQIQRAALTLSNGLIFVAWAGYCDIQPFHGYVMAFNKDTLQPSGVFVTTPDGYDGGIWNSGSGAAVDSGNNIYLPTGNGLFDLFAGGVDYSDSILRLSWAGGLPDVTDYFTPWDQVFLNIHDDDEEYLVPRREVVCHVGQATGPGKAKDTVGVVDSSSKQVEKPVPRGEIDIVAGIHRSARTTVPNSSVIAVGSRHKHTTGLQGILIERHDITVKGLNVAVARPGDEDQSIGER